MALRVVDDALGHANWPSSLDVRSGLYGPAARGAYADARYAESLPAARLTKLHRVLQEGEKATQMHLDMAKKIMQQLADEPATTARRPVSQPQE